MSKAGAVMARTLMVCFLCAACQNQSSTPTVDYFSVMNVDGTSIQFIREPPVTKANREYLDGDSRGVLTLQDNCLRLGEDGPVIIWPPDFTPHIKGGVIEVQNAKGQVVARVGDPITVWGGQLQKDADDCPGPTWVDTRFPDR